MNATNQGGPTEAKTGWMGTPGPWEPIKGVEEDDGMRCAVAAVRDDRRYLVAMIENGAPGDCCDTEFANAKGIAAVPSMVEALVAFIDLEDAAEHLAEPMSGDLLERIEAARAALKAAGVHP